MEEIKCKQVAQISSVGFTEMTGRVYDRDGLSPSIRTFSGGNTEVKILEEPLVWGGFNQRVRQDSTTVGCITRNVGSDLKRSGQGIIEPVIIEDFYKNRGNRIYEDASPCIRADRAGLKVSEAMCAASRGRNPENPSDRTAGIPTQQRLEVNRDGTTNTLTSVQKDNMVIEPTDGEIRVRKLTEKECFRLMGVKDEDFAKIRRNQSKSSCYHLAGDSIVTTCLMAIFGEILGRDWRTAVENLADGLCEDGKSERSEK